MSESYGIVDRTRSQTSAEQHAERIRLLGYSIVEGELAQSQVDAMPGQIDALLERQAGEAGGWDRLRDIGDQGTARCCLAYDGAFVPLATNPAILAICRLLLGDYFVLMQQNAVINAPEQVHTQRAYHRDLPYQHFTSSRPLAISALFCADPFTMENGATHLIPGSHKVEEFPSEPLIDQVEEVVEAAAGSYIVFDAMLFHRAGTNLSDRPRRAVNQVYSLPFIGQQISIPAMLGGRYSDDPALARLFGYDTEPAASVDGWRDRRRSRLRTR